MNIKIVAMESPSKIQMKRTKVWIQKTEMKKSEIREIIINN